MPKSQISFICLLFLFGTSHFAVAREKKSRTCSGRVTDQSGKPIAGSTLLLIRSSKKTSANDQGVFRLEGIERNKDELRVSHLGYKTQILKIDFEKDVQLNIVLEDGTDELKEIQVVGKSENRKIAEQPVLTQVVNMKSVQEQPNTLIELLNRSSGIRIRQTGGLGAPSNITINGFQNRSVRYFKDGIPLDYLGGGFDLSLVPVNMLDHVEVYKGVLPATLGADALGGALNMVTKKSFNRYVDVSYETGSFNTHRTAVNAYYKNDAKKFFFGTDAFYNYSDNNYKVDVKVSDPNTGSEYEVNTPLFHNRFKNYYAEIYGGIAGTSWADELRLGLTAFSVDRQINYGSSMSQAIGAATNGQRAIIPTLRYKKALFDKKLSIDQFFVVNTLKVSQLDTAKGQYNWLGEFTPSDSRLGELVTRGSDAHINYDYYTSRTNFGYMLTEKQKLDLNMVFSGFARKGNDPYGQVFANNGMDVLQNRASYHKIILALGLTSNLLNDRLSNQFVIKHYRYATDATDADYQGNALTHNNKQSSWGLAEAIKFVVTENSFIRASAETALRLPEQDELFGDGDRKLSNFLLKPERSLNANLGYRLETKKGHHLEINSFYRITRNLILAMPHNFLFTQSQNIDNVRGIGFEADGEINLLSWLKANGNFTYQDQRLFDTGNPGTEKARLRNTPYFFANASLNGTFNQIFSKQDKIQLSWYYSFVREYYLDAIPKDKEPDGFLGLWGKAKLDVQNVIPNQSQHSFGVTYYPQVDGFSAGLQVKNIFDVPIYDNFRIQNAGRSIFIKLNYSIRSK